VPNSLPQYPTTVVGIPEVPHGATLDMLSIGALAFAGKVSQNDGDLIAPAACASDTDSALCTSAASGRVCRVTDLHLAA
jgi:hypothetical protein